jgi:hypothetical protein
MPNTAPPTVGPVYDTPARSRAACNVPSSPGPPWQQLSSAEMSRGRRFPTNPSPATSRSWGALRGGPSRKSAASSVGSTSKKSPVLAQ